MSSTLAAVIGLLGTAAFFGLALWFWKRGQTRPAAPTSQDGETQFIPRDQLFGQSPGGERTEFVDPQEAFRIADRGRAQRSDSHEPGAAVPPTGTEYIPREELMAKIGRPGATGAND